jgi:hypothetical protein
MITVTDDLDPGKFLDRLEKEVRKGVTEVYAGGVPMDENERILRQAIGAPGAAREDEKSQKADAELQRLLNRATL